MEKSKLSHLEFEILTIVLQMGRASVREVHEEVSKKRPLNYSTVKTILTRLEGKGAVARLRKISNAIIYESAVRQQELYGQAIHDFLGRLFGGSVRPLISYLVESEQLSLEDLKDIERMIRQRRTGPGRRSGG